MFNIAESYDCSMEGDIYEVGVQQRSWYNQSSVQCSFFNLAKIAASGRLGHHGLERQITRPNLRRRSARFDDIRFALCRRRSMGQWWTGGLNRSKIYGDKIPMSPRPAPFVVIAGLWTAPRSEERRVGKEGVSTCR